MLRLYNEFMDSLHEKLDEGELNSLALEVKALSGKLITAEAAAILTAHAQKLME